MFMILFCSDKLVSQFYLQVALEDPKRFRIEMTFSRGADLSPLEVMYQYIHDVELKDNLNTKYMLFYVRS